MPLFFRHGSNDGVESVISGRREVVLHSVPLLQLIKKILPKTSEHTTSTGRSDWGGGDNI